MLRVTQIANAGACKAYFRSSDYYVEGQEKPAQWHGKAATALGLSGEVRSEDFNSLADNLHPLTGDKLTNAKGARRVGYDFTFSVPKSVTLAYTLGGDSRIEDAFRNAVADTMASVEADISTRVRKNKADFDRPTGNMAWVDFLHTTSRPINGVPDPQLHIHAVAFSLTQDPAEDNEWKAGQFGDLKASANYYQAAFRSRLAAGLESLGYTLERKGKDDFEIAGVGSKALLDRFSRRTALIEGVADKLGITKPESKAKLGATTRESKKAAEHLAWDALLEKWNARLSVDERSGLGKTVAHARANPHTPAYDEHAAVEYAVAHAFERSSVRTDRQIATVAMQKGLGSVRPDAVMQAVLSHPELVRDGGFTTTRQALADEREILAFATSRRGKLKPLGDVRSVPEATLKALSPSQAGAVRHVLTSRDPLTMVRGLAGVGKTHALKAALDAVNVPYVALAPSAEASRKQLRESGIQGADTLAKFLNDSEMQKRAAGGLIVLDEASLSGSQSVSQLTRIAAKNGSRILLLGDRAQHKSPARGDVLGLLADKGKLPAYEIGCIRRQQRKDYRTAVEELARGEVSAAVGRLDDMGWIREAGSDALADDYLAAIKAKQTAIIVAPTHAHGAAVTDRLRERLREAGLLTGEEKAFISFRPCHLTEAERGDAEALASAPGRVAVFFRKGAGQMPGTRVEITPENAGLLAKAAGSFSVYDVHAAKLAKGDVVRLAVNTTTADGENRLSAGSQYAVKGFTDKGVLLDNGRVAAFDAGFSHGYTSTSHAAQGRTCDRVLISLPPETFPALTKETLYVAVSRGRHEATVYTTDKKGLLEAASRGDVRKHAVDVPRPAKKRRKLRDRARANVRLAREVIVALRDRLPGNAWERKESHGR